MEWDLHPYSPLANRYAYQHANRHPKPYTNKGVS